MTCLKRYFFLFVFALLGSLFISLSLNVNDSFAASVDCGEVISNVTLTSSPSLSFSCDTSSLDSSKPWFYSSSFTYSQDSPHGGTSPFLSFSPSSYSALKTTFVRLRLNEVSFSGSSLVTDLGDSRFSYVVSSSFSNDLFSYFTFSLSLVISDSCPLCPSPPSGSLSIIENGTYDVTNYAEAVVDVPAQVIQGDYHDDLLSINHSILICGAILLVLYFFYCIYRMIIKSTGGK